LNEALYLLNDQRIVDRLRKLPFYEDIKYALMLGLGGAPLSDPLSALGQTDIAALVDRCTASERPASRTIKLLHALGADSLPWFMSFGSSLESELVAPAFSVEYKVTGELTALDADLTADHDVLEQRAQDGWTRILANAAVQEGLAMCAAGRSSAGVPR
jgi:hypothetical protein